MERKRAKILPLLSLSCAGKIKPVAYTAFVVTEKIQKRLKAKQRQREQKLLLSRTYLSFVDSFFLLLLLFLNFVQIIALNLTYARKM